MGTDAIHPDVRIGHVHLSVADLDRAIDHGATVVRDLLPGAARPPAG